MTVGFQSNDTPHALSVMADSMESFTNFLESMLTSIEELLKSVGEFLTHAKDISQAFEKLNGYVEDFFKSEWINVDPANL